MGVEGSGVYAVSLRDPASGAVFDEQRPRTVSDESRRHSHDEQRPRSVCPMSLAGTPTMSSGRGART